MADKGKAAFNMAAEGTLDEALAVSNQRGGEYRDSWALDNQVTTFIDHVLDLLGLDPALVDPRVKRLIMVAALADVKDSRMLGPWKSDTVIDGINYRAAFASWRQEYEDRFNPEDSGSIARHVLEDPYVPAFGDLR